MDKPYFVYIIHCEGESLYTGITTDLPRRLAQHRGERPGSARYTQAHRPLHPEAVWSAPNRSSASRLEYRIKTLTRQQKERLIKQAITITDLFADQLCTEEYQFLCFREVIDN